MEAWATGLITLACVLGGALLGLKLQQVLPEHHLDARSQDVVKLVAGLLATLSALVLGLLIASSKSTFDSLGEDFKQSATKVIVADRMLGEYGPETIEARRLLKQSYSERIARLFGDQSVSGDVRRVEPAAASLEAFHRSMRSLAPSTDRQRAIVEKVQQLVDDVTATRWHAFEEATSTTPPVFLAVLVSWLVMMFASFGLFAPRHGTAVAALFCGSLAVATSIFLIEEMNRPFGGLIAIPGQPMRDALSVLGR